MDDRITRPYTPAGFALPDIDMTPEQAEAWVNGYLAGWDRGYLEGYERGDREEAAALRSLLTGAIARDRVLRERGEAA